MERILFSLVYTGNMKINESEKVYFTHTDTSVGDSYMHRHYMHIYT